VGRHPAQLFVIMHDLYALTSRAAVIMHDLYADCRCDLALCVQRRTDPA
jgi:hypothetical protein